MLIVWVLANSFDVHLLWSYLLRKLLCHLTLIFGLPRVAAMKKRWLKYFGWPFGASPPITNGYLYRWTCWCFSCWSCQCWCTCRCSSWCIWTEVKQLKMKVVHRLWHWPIIFIIWARPQAVLFKLSSVYFCPWNWAWAKDDKSGHDAHMSYMSV